jgi:hypothetical protein
MNCGGRLGSEVAIFNCQTTVAALSSSPPIVKPLEQGELHRHCHHPPGIKNFHSDSYAEIGTVRLCTRLRALCAVGTFKLSVTVKPFEQRELHRTVTICPELGILNQTVTQK